MMVKRNRRNHLRKRLTPVLSISLVAALATVMIATRSVHASAVITVNSTDDTAVAADGLCTLREAINNVNTASDTTANDCIAGSGGADTIQFAITGAGDYTIGSQDGHTIVLNSPLPTVTSPVTIDGYSQAGAAPNTAVSPAPLNGTLLIQIDGEGLSNLSNANTPCLEFDTGSDGSVVQGLVINRCGNDGIRIYTANSLQILGNYVGTNPTGLVAAGNGRDNTTDCAGSGIAANASNHLQIGGTNPADRNVIGSNQCDDVYIQNEGDNANPSSNNTIQGNYIGLGADGLTPLPAGWEEGKGNAMLFGNSHNDLIGGTATGAKNVIATSNEFGLSFRDGCSNTIIQGNYVGTDYTGNATIAWSKGTGNINSAVHIFALGSSPSHDFLVGGTTTAARNVISGNSYTVPGHNWSPAGVAIEEGAYNNIVEGNYIGVGADGTTALGNQDAGVKVYNNGHNTNNNIVGGITAQARNVIANNGRAGIMAGQNSTEAMTNGVSILQNSIYSNSGLGIDLGDDGVTLNHYPPIMSGPNASLNFPEYSDIISSAGDTTIDYRLNVPAGDYRIEFYSNSVADPSGYGQGQTYLGFQDVTSTGNGSQDYTKILSGVSSVSNLALTATQILPSSFSGFGPSSEFGGQLPPDVSITKTLDNPQDVVQGATLHYDITLHDSGGPVDLSQFNGLGNPFASALFIDFLPPDLTFVNTTTPGVSCVNNGTFADSVLIPSHPDYNFIVCSYAGAQALTRNQSFTATINITVNSNSDLAFTNYAFTGWVTGDPDTATLQSALFATPAVSGTTDMIDYLLAHTNGNFTTAVYPTPASPSTNNSTPEQLTPGVPNTGLGSLDGRKWTGLAVSVVGLCLVVGAYTIKKVRDSHQL